jgi:PRTRC genetic system ThiF family protein
MSKRFSTPSDWLDRRLRVALLGGGRTGGEVVHALSRIDCMLRDRKHPGLHVTLIDGDQVSPANVGNQRFAPCDVSSFKADLLIQRLNLFYGLDWDSITRFWSPGVSWLRLTEIDLLVSCVDRARVRVQIAEAGARLNVSLLWLDFGNGDKTGQCVLGHLGSDPEGPLRLPHVYDLFPELRTIKDDDTPSCSTAEALRQQDLFVNPLLAQAGAILLWNLLRHGHTDSHGAFVNAREPGCEPLLIDPQVWASFGYVPRSQAPRKERKRRCA